MPPASGLEQLQFISSQFWGLKSEAAGRKQLSSASRAEPLLCLAPSSFLQSFAFNLSFVVVFSFTPDAVRKHSGQKQLREDRFYLSSEFQDTMLLKGSNGDISLRYGSDHTHSSEQKEMNASIPTDLLVCAQPDLPTLVQFRIPCIWEWCRP